MRNLALLFIPTAAGLVVSVASSGVQRRLRPAMGARLLTIAAISIAAAMALALAAVGFAFVTEIPWVASTFGWCRSVVHTDAHVPASIGVAALSMLAAVSWRGMRFLRTSPWTSSDTPPKVVLVDSNVVQAVAIPGRPDQILVSKAMIDVLDDDETEAMLAHERAHLRHRHYRLLTLAGAASASVPLVRPICARVRFCTERWADESAAEEIGDRNVVARAIAKAALARAAIPNESGLGLLGAGVPIRVEALLMQPRRSRAASATLLILGLTGVAFSIAASTLQLHHLVAFALHVCAIH